MRECIKILFFCFLVTLVIVNVFAASMRMWRAPVSVRVGPLTPRSSSIILYCNPSQIFIGEKTTICGRLVNATGGEGIPNQPIHLYYRPSGEYSWTYITQVYSSMDGSFIYLWDASSTLTPGYYVVNATFIGNNDFDPWTGITDLQVISLIANQLVVDIVDPSPPDGARVTPPITFRVRVSCGGLPVQDAYVTFYYGNGGTGRIGYSMTDVNGIAEVKDWDPGWDHEVTFRWWAEAWRAGYQDGISQKRTLTVVPPSPPPPPSHTILYVPHQYQGDAAWCGPSSLAMVLRYYGFIVHSWDIAKDLGLRKDEGVTFWNLESYVRNKYPSLEVYARAIKSEEREEIFSKIRENLDFGYPVIVGLNYGGEQDHAVVFVGYNQTGFFINDPSAADIQDYNKVEFLYGLLPEDYTVLLVVKDEPPEQYRQTLHSVTLSIKSGDIYLLNIQKGARYDLVLNRGLEWNDTGGAGPVDKNFALFVSLRVSNHLPYEQNLIARIDVLGEDNKVYYSSQETISVGQLEFEVFQKLWGILLRNYLTKSQKYQIIIAVLNQTKNVMDFYMTPWFDYTANYNYQVNVEDIDFTVIIDSNSTVSDFNFSQQEKQITFTVSGQEGTTGSCNVTIPKNLLYGEPWTVTVDGTQVPATITENTTHTFIYFTYNHSTKTVTIKGTHVIPEFSSTPILILLMLTTIITTTLRKTKRKHQTL